MSEHFFKKVFQNILSIPARGHAVPSDPLLIIEGIKGWASTPRVPFNIRHLNWFKFVSAGLLVYSSYYILKYSSNQSPFHFRRIFKNLFLKYKFNKNKNNNNIDFQIKEIPEYAKYDNGWYAEFDELKLKQNLNHHNNIITELSPLDPIRETTPRGDILMYYDVNNKSFIYYSNNKNIPYATLDAVARKYVCLKFAPPAIYIDIRDEIQKGQQKCIKKENSKKNNDNSPSFVKKSLFAVFKNYKTGTGKGKTNNNSQFINDKNKNTIKNNTINNNDDKIILKDNVNKFVFKGQIGQYETDTIKIKEEPIENSHNQNINIKETDLLKNNNNSEYENVNKNN